MTRPVIRFRIDFGPDRAIGPGKIALLERIALDGSLRLAARHLSLSYRRAWQLLNSLNSTFTDPVTISTKGGRNGGGAKLTPLGEHLIQVYRSFDAEVQSQVSQRFRNLASATAKGQRVRNSAPIRRLSDR